MFLRFTLKFSTSMNKLHFSLDTDIFQIATDCFQILHSDFFVYAEGLQILVVYAFDSFLNLQKNFSFHFPTDFCYT